MSADPENSSNVSETEMGRCTERAITRGLGEGSEGEEAEPSVGERRLLL